MAETKLIRDHHLLTRNLRLNGKYISNDGGNEGISIDDTGDVTLSSVNRQLRLAYDSDSYCNFTVDSNSDLTITPQEGGMIKIDHDLDTTTGGINTGFYLDMDRTGDVSTGLDTNVGLTINVSATGASGGFISTTGQQIVVVGDTGGSSATYGLTINCSGADTNNGISVTCSERQLNMSHDFNSYSQIHCAQDSHTTWMTAESGDIKLDAGGDIYLDSGSGVYRFLTDTDADSYVRMYSGGNGQSFTISTNVGAEDVANTGDFTLDIAGDITLDSSTGIILCKDNGGNYTPPSDYAVATKKYVDDNAGGITTGKAIAMAIVFG